MRPFIVHNSHMMHTMVHTWRGQGCSIFVEINVNRQSNPRHSVVHSTLKHLNSYSKLFQNMISKSVHHFGISAGVIRVNALFNEILQRLGSKQTRSRWKWNDDIYLFSHCLYLLRPQSKIMLLAFHGAALWFF